MGLGYQQIPSRPCLHFIRANVYLFLHDQLRTCTKVIFAFAVFLTNPDSSARRRCLLECGSIASLLSIASGYCQACGNQIVEHNSDNETVLEILSDCGVDCDTDKCWYLKPANLRTVAYVSVTR